MIVIAHNYVHVLELCDRVNLLRNGRIMLDKRTDETSGRGADRDRRRRVPRAEVRGSRAGDGPDERAELGRELRVRAEALVQPLRQRPEPSVPAASSVADRLLDLVR